MPYVTIPLDDRTHAALAEYASRRGARVGIIAAALLEQVLSAQDENSPEFRLWRKSWEAKKRMMQYTLLQEIALSLPNSSAEEHAEFSELCAALGFCESEIIDSVQRIDQRVAKSGDSRQILTAIRHLQRILDENGGEIPAYWAEKEMQQAGFSKAAVREARRALGVRSVRGPRQWLWRVEDGEDGEDNGDNEGQR